jgi:hypothetical protein
LDLGYEGVVGKYMSMNESYLRIGVIKFVNESMMEEFLNFSISFTDNYNFNFINRSFYYNQNLNYIFWVSGDYFIWLTEGVYDLDDFEDVILEYYNRYDLVDDYNVQEDEYDAMAEYVQMDIESLDYNESKYNGSYMSQNTQCDDACDSRSSKTDLSSNNCHNLANYYQGGSTYSYEQQMTRNDECIDSNTLKEYFLKCDDGWEAWCPSGGPCYLDRIYFVRKDCNDLGDYSCYAGACVLNQYCDFDPVCEYTSKRECVDNVNYDKHIATGTECDGGCIYNHDGNYPCIDGMYCSGTKYDGVKPCYLCSRKCDGSCQSSNCYGFDPDCNSDGSVNNDICCSDSDCDTGEECNDNVCEVKSCSDYDNNDGSCSYNNYFWGLSECRNGDPTKCSKFDKIYCWEYTDYCTSDEFCDENGIGDSKCTKYPCEITGNSWSKSSVTEGNQVTLTVTGEHCSNSDTASVKILEVDGDYFGSEYDNSSQNYTAQGFWDFLPANDDDIKDFGLKYFDDNEIVLTWTASWQNDYESPNNVYRIASKNDYNQKYEGDLSVIKSCIDNDEDGYGTEGSTGCTYNSVDCNDNNKNVHPGVQEVCNGIDDNCIGGIDEAEFMCGQYGLCESGSCRQKNCIELGYDMGSCSDTSDSDCVGGNVYECDDVIPGLGGYEACYVFSNECTDDESCDEGWPNANCVLNECELIEAFWRMPGTDDVQALELTHGDDVELYVKGNEYCDEKLIDLDLYEDDWLGDDPSFKVNDGVFIGDFAIGFWNVKWTPDHGTDSAEYYFKANYNGDEVESSNLIVNKDPSLDWECNEDSDCGIRYCDDWGNDYCSLFNNVYQKRNCYDPVCSDHVCYDEVDEEESDMIDDCKYGCESGICLDEFDGLFLRGYSISKDYAEIGDSIVIIHDVNIDGDGPFEAGFRTHFRKNVNHSNIVTVDYTDLLNYYDEPVTSLYFILNESFEIGEYDVSWEVYRLDENREFSERMFVSDPFWELGAITIGGCGDGVCGGNEDVNSCFEDCRVGISIMDVDPKLSAYTDEQIHVTIEVFNPSEDMQERTFTAKLIPTAVPQNNELNSEYCYSYTPFDQGPLEIEGKSSKIKTYRFNAPDDEFLETCSLFNMFGEREFELQVEGYDYINERVEQVVKQDYTIKDCNLFAGSVEYCSCEYDTDCGDDAYCNKDVDEYGVCLPLENCLIPDGSSERCACTGDNDCEEFGMVCDLNNGRFGGCELPSVDQRCEHLNQYFCEDGILYECFYFANYILVPHKIEICPLNTVCIDDPRLDPGCMVVDDYNIIIENDFVGDYVNKQPGDNVRIYIESSEFYEVDLSYNSDVFEFVSGDCFDYTSKDNSECVFRIRDDAYGEYVFKLGNVEKKVNVISATNIYITDFDQLRKRYKDDYGVDNLLSRMYDDSLENYGVVYNLDEEISEIHLFESRVFDDYSSALLPMSSRNNAFASDVGQFINDRCESCENIIVVGDDYVVPHYQKIISEYESRLLFKDRVIDHAFYSDISYTKREDILLSDFEEIFVFDDNTEGKDVGFIIPDNVEVEMLNEISRFKNVLGKYGPDIKDDVLSSDVNCIDDRWFRKAAGKTLIIVGGDGNNQALECYPFIDVDNLGEVAFIERNLWDPDEYAIIINSDNPEVLKTFTSLVETQELLKLRSKYAYFFEVSTDYLGYAAMVGGTALLVAGATIGSGGTSIPATLILAGAILEGVSDGSDVANECFVNSDDSYGWCGATMGMAIIPLVPAKPVKKILKNIDDDVLKKFRPHKPTYTLNKNVKKAYFTGDIWFKISPTKQEAYDLAYGLRMMFGDLGDLPDDIKDIEKLIPDDAKKIEKEFSKRIILKPGKKSAGVSEKIIAKKLAEADFLKKLGRVGQKIDEVNDPALREELHKALKKNLDSAKNVKYIYAKGPQFEIENLLSENFDNIERVAKDFPRTVDGDTIPLNYVIKNGRDKGKLFSNLDGEIDILKRDASLQI